LGVSIGKSPGSFLAGSASASGRRRLGAGLANIFRRRLYGLSRISVIWREL
jgi:hypothetical protein